MQIQLMSDLHMEVNPQFVPQPAPLADVLVLAGDIGSYQAGSSLLSQAHDQRDWGLSRFSPALGNWPCPVMFVPGNHEFDGLDLDEARLQLAEVCTRLGIVCLDNQSTVLGGVRFVGSTLWTDFDALANHTTYKPRSWSNAQTRAYALRDKSFKAANHYLRDNHCLRNGQAMLAAEIAELGLQSQAWLRTQLELPSVCEQWRATVAITHFAPSLLSADPRYGIQPGTCGFCNALDELVPKATVWLHGHLHAPSHYQLGGTHVWSNPLGYAPKEQHNFVAQRLIEI